MKTTTKYSIKINKHDSIKHKNSYKNNKMLKIKPQQKSSLL